MRGELYCRVTGIINKIEEGGLEYNRVLNGLQAVSEGRDFVKSKPAVLRMISGGEQIIISATTGVKTIASATDVFTCGIDSDFKNWGLDVPGEAKPGIRAEVYEMIQDGDFKTIYGSVGRDLGTLYFTEEQVVVFVRDHKKWLRTSGYATFFLFKVGDEFFVARVGLPLDERPYADVRRFSDNFMWPAFVRLRVVLPKV